MHTPLKSNLITWRLLKFEIHFCGYIFHCSIAVKEFFLTKQGQHYRQIFEIKNQISTSIQLCLEFSTENLGPKKGENAQEKKKQDQEGNYKGCGGQFSCNPLTNVKILFKSYFIKQQVFFLQHKNSIASEPIEFSILGKLHICLMVLGYLIYRLKISYGFTLFSIFPILQIHTPRCQRVTLKLNYKTITLFLNE